MNFSDAVEEIKSRIDIVELIAEYIDLKRAGRNYKALCPFHPEKTPSFVVNPERQFFHCFGCGAGGDIITFVMRYEGMEFKEAINVLARRAGIVLQEFKASHKVDYRSRLVEIHKAATEFFREHLHLSQEAMRYFLQRGLSRTTIERFMLGYAPAGGDVLYRHLIQKGFSENEILMSGLCKKTDGAVVIDTFRRRVVFPITNLKGEVIAFGGRVISDEQMGPKYLNSPESILFKKSNELFGLYQAREAIKKKGYVILVEGYMDVLTACQSDIGNVVAPLGTALTEGQLRKLKMLTDKVLLLFDADEAGIRASKRALALCYQQGFTAKVLLLPDGDDPDTFLRKHGFEGLKRLIPEAKALIDFLLYIDKDSESVAREVIEIISSVPDPITRGSIVRELSEKTGISETFLLEELKRLREKRTGFRQARPSSTLTGSETILIPDEEKTLIGIYVCYPEYRGMLKERIQPEIFQDQKVRELYKKIVDNEHYGEVLSDEELSFVSSLATSFELDPEEIHRVIDDCVHKLRAKVLKKRIAEVQAMIKEEEEKQNLKKITELQHTLVELIKEGRSEGIL